MLGFLLPHLLRQEAQLLTRIVVLLQLYIHVHAPDDTYTDTDTDRQTHAHTHTQWHTVKHTNKHYPPLLGTWIPAAGVPLDTLAPD